MLESFHVLLLILQDLAEFETTIRTMQEQLAPYQVLQQQAGPVGIATACSSASGAANHRLDSVKQGRPRAS